jgi:regulator of sigma E protease|tara:strand:+ start:3382 stop:4728 length:1347 start_codon:yes stop_codon:yes gene_type:complete
LDIATLMSQFGGFFWMIIAFVVALSVIVAIHEYGHYIVGRWTGIHAEVFSLGFGPVLYSRVDKRGTVWQVAALPFGGYVKFAGDANAASGVDGEAMAEVADNPVARRRTMHGAPLWARALTVVAGPVFNFALSIAIFFGVLMFAGQPSDPLTVASLKNMPGEATQLREGDRVLGIDGQKFDGFEAAVSWALTTQPSGRVLNYAIERDGEAISVTGPYLAPARVGNIAPLSAASDAGLREGDVITHIDGNEITTFLEMKDIVEASNGRGLDLSVWREGAELQVTLTPKRVDEPLPEGGFQTQWRIGIMNGLAFEPATESADVGTALYNSVRQVGRIIEGSISGLGHMITGAISTCNLSGPIGIAQTSGAMASQGAESFIWFIAVLSTAVGLLNLFPIPALDGGHLVFYAYEAVVGRPPSDGALRILMGIGLTMVLALMVFALGNDLFCP